MLNDCNYGLWTMNYELKILYLCRENNKSKQIKQYAK